MKQMKQVLRDMAEGEGGVRPLMGLEAEQILGLSAMLDGKPHRQLDVLFQAWVEVSGHRNSSKALHKALEGQFVTSGVRPEPWIGNAMRAAQGVKRTTRGRHHLYVLVCDGYDDDGKGLGLYVGRSKYLPETRFGQHASGLEESHAARLFRRDRNGPKHKPLALLPSFFNHLNPLPKAEAEVLEVALVEAMVAAGVPASRVGGPRDRSEDESEPDEPSALAGEDGAPAT